jgi:hypothetical protein
MIDDGVPLLKQLAVGGAMVLAMALVHFTAFALLFHWLKSRQPAWATSRIAPVPVLLAAFGGVLAVHAAEIWLYAVVYVLVGAIPELETALYFSTVSYASIGYGDVLLSKSWRILGAIEGAAGVILLGCSTAFLVAVITELQLFERARFLALSTPSGTRGSTVARRPAAERPIPLARGSPAEEERAP